MAKRRKNAAVPAARKTRSAVAGFSARLVRNTVFRRTYAVTAVLVLFGTTLLWAILGARLQGHNADQLSDPYLFSNATTFRGAFFPGSHTFLLKWPVFWLIHAFGLTQTSLAYATVGLVLATVAALAFVLYKIDRRPLVFGTVCLGLSLALLLVPAQPYAGALLPVNMAMLTTRNVEYAVYLASLGLFARAKRLKSRNFAAGALPLALLVASDKLFLSLSLGGALLALITYAAFKAWHYVGFALCWLAGGVAAAIGASVILFGLSALHVTHFVAGGSVTPYGPASGAHGIMLGAIYAVLGLLTNTGANPAYDNLIVSRLPNDVLHGLLSLGGPAYVAASLSLLYALRLMWRLNWRVPQAKPRTVPPAANLLALALTWSTAAAVSVFVVSDHYYPVDARYLTIGLFALAVSVSVELRKRRWQRPERLLPVAAGLCVAIALATGGSLHISRVQTAALNGVEGRNAVIVAALRRHKVDVLVGSYWRVLPAKLAMHGSINAMPLTDCTQPNSLLTSSAWQPDLHTHSFAYLLTISGSVAGFPDCTLNSVVAAYGRPNALQVVAGTVAHPTEALLFYDQGSHPPVSAKERATPVSILPVTVDSLTYTGCAGPTIMNVVAHEDDDLLFLSPDLLHEIRGGDCVRTVFLTAGDDGQDSLYWLSRQLGSEAAYDSMLGKKQIWVQQTVELAKGKYVTMDSPRGDPKITLVFFNLPDGNINGEGFPRTDFQSLAKLWNGTVLMLRTVDGQSAYSSAQLVTSLARLMQLYRPAEIHTQADVSSVQYSDHSDHVTTGTFTQAAAAAYDQQEFAGEVTTPLKRYIGYPIHGYAQNVSGADLEQKAAAFFAYGGYDDGVCGAWAGCQQTVYWFYLPRQYQE